MTALSGQPRPVLCFLQLAYPNPPALTISPDSISTPASTLVSMPRSMPPSLPTPAAAHNPERQQQPACLLPSQALFAPSPVAMETLTPAFSLAALPGLARKELQALAKTAGVRANSKTVDMLADLRAYHAEHWPVDETAPTLQGTAPPAMAAEAECTATKTEPMVTTAESAVVIAEGMPEEVEEELPMAAREPAETEPPVLPAASDQRTGRAAKRKATSAPEVQSMFSLHMRTLALGVAAFYFVRSWCRLATGSAAPEWSPHTPDCMSNPKWQV